MMVFVWSETLKIGFSSRGLFIDTMCWLDTRKPHFDACEKKQRRKPACTSLQYFVLSPGVISFVWLFVLLCFFFRVAFFRNFACLGSVFSSFCRAITPGDKTNTENTKWHKPATIVMSAHVLLTFLTSCGKAIKCEACIQ